MISFIRRYKVDILVGIFALAFCVYFSIASINRLYTFRSNYFDLGIMDQVVYNTAHGRFLEMTNQDLRSNASRFAIHFDPLLAFFSPLYLIYSNPIVLLIGQAFVVACGAYAVYLIAQKILKNKWASFLFALSYLFYFPNQRAVLFDVHAVVFATTFLLFAIYFSLVKKYWLTLIFILLSLLTKEHIGLITLLFGMYIFFFQKERKIGIVISIVSLIFFFSTFLFIIPHARQASHFALRYFEDIGDSPTGIIISLIKNPLYLFSKLSKEQTRQYLSGLFFPHIVFMIFAPIEFLISLPELVINLISSNSNMRAIYFHYNSALIPFIYFSTITGFYRMKKVITSRKWQRIFIAVAVFSNLFFVYKYAPLPFPFFSDPFYIQPINQKKLSSIYEWQKILADESIPVATSPQIAPFFTRRKYYYNFLFDTGYQGAGLSENDIIKDINLYRKAKYIVIGYSEVRGEGSLPQKFYKNLKTNTEYTMVYRKDGIVVYSR